MTTFFYFNNLVQTTEQVTQRILSLIVLKDLIDPEEIMSASEETFYNILDRYEQEEV